MRRRNPFLVGPTAGREYRPFFIRSIAEDFAVREERLTGRRPPMYAISDREYKWRRKAEFEARRIHALAPRRNPWEAGVEDVYGRRAMKRFVSRRPSVALTRARRYAGRLNRDFRTSSAPMQYRVYDLGWTPDTRARRNPPTRRLSKSPRRRSRRNPLTRREAVRHIDFARGSIQAASRWDRESSPYFIGEAKGRLAPVMMHARSSKDRAMATSWFDYAGRIQRRYSKNSRRRSRRNPWYIGHVSPYVSRSGKPEREVFYAPRRPSARRLGYADISGPWKTSRQALEAVRGGVYGKQSVVRRKRRSRRNPLSYIPYGTSVKTTKAIHWHGLHIPKGAIGKVERMLEGGEAARVDFGDRYGKFDVWVNEIRPHLRRPATWGRKNPLRKSRRRKNPWYVGKKRGRSYVWRSRKAPRYARKRHGFVKRYRYGGHAFARVSKHRSRRSAIRKARGTTWVRAKNARRGRYRKNPWPLLAAASVGPIASWWYDAFKGKSKRKSTRRRRRAFRRNPASALPMRRGQKMPIKKFEAWLESNGSPRDKKQFARIKKKYSELHLGTEPTRVGFDITNVDGSKKVRGRMYMASMGKSPTSTYIVSKRSGKSEKGKSVAYEHQWGESGGRMPHLLVDASGRTIVQLLRGKSKASKGWLRG